MMKILFVVRAGNHPATRLRVVQYLGHLKGAGIESEVVAFPSGLLEWWRLLRKANDADAVFFQKKRVNRFWLKRLKSKGVKLIYDFDDAVMFNSSRHLNPDSPARMRHFASMVRRCDFIIAGNEYLKSFAEPYNKNLRVLPTVVDTDKYKVKVPGPETGRVILGWIGGGKSLVFLKKLQPVLDRLSEKHAGVSLKIVCNAFFEPVKMPIINKEWSEAEEADDMLSFDIGLAPLPDDPWSQGKCATKLLQYMASGVPAVASAVGVHKDIIKEGVNGFLARNDQEWFDKIRQLAQDRLLRQRLGTAARQTVEEYYSVRANAPKLAEILKGIK